MLEGSVRKSGTRLRVTAELVNAADGCQVWSARYDREMDMRDIFEVQDELTRTVLDAVRPNLPAPSAVIAQNRTKNVVAHECANARRGKHREAEATRARLVQLSRDRYVSPYHVAIACNGLNEPSEAIVWLERALEARDPMMVFLKVEPIWRNLRDGPRFRALLKKMKLL